MQANYVDSSTFTVSEDRTSEFVEGRRIKADCGTDGEKISEVTSSSYDSSSNKTTINIDDAVLTSNLSEVFYAVVSPGSKGSLPLHTHENDGQGGSGVQDIIMPLARLERIARGDYQSHAAMKGYTDVFFERLLDESKIASIGSNVVVSTGRKGNVVLDTYNDVGLIWTKSLGGNRHRITYKGGYIYVAVDDTIYKLNPDGSEVWSNTYADLDALDPFVTDDGVIYCAYSSAIRKFNDSDGSHIEDISPDVSYYHGALVVDADGYIYTCYSDFAGSSVHKFDSEGNTVAASNSYNYLKDVSLYSDQYVFAASGDTAGLIKLNISDLSEVWTLDSDVNAVVVHDASGSVYYSTGSIKRIDLNGNNQWSSGSGSIPTVIDVDPDNYAVYFGNGSDVIGLKCSDGSSLFSYSAESGSDVYSVAAAPDNIVYFDNNDQASKLSAEAVYYYSSGSLTSADINLGYTPSTLRVEQDVDIPADEDIQYDIEDKSGNIVTVSQSEIGTQVDASSFASGETAFTASPNLSTSDGDDTPTLNEYAVYFK